MTKFIVVTPNLAGELVPLRGTIWAYSMDRAQQFETRELAQAALDRAKKFTKASSYKQARIVEVQS